MGETSYYVLSIADGITLQDVTGTLPGTLILFGFEDQLDIITSTTLDMATIEIGQNAAIDLAALGGTLTLGPNLTLQTEYSYLAKLDDLSGPGGGGIINDGTIDSDSFGVTVDVEGGAFTNNGLITVYDGGFYEGATDFSNTGTVSVTYGVLTLNGAWTNTGVITVIAATLDLGGDLTTAQVPADLADITLSDSVVNFVGTIDNTASTLDVGPGSALGDLGITLGLAKGGDIIGGTILDEGDGLIFPYDQSGTLDRVTYQGTLDLSEAEYYQLTIADGITLQDVTGTLPGTLLLTGYGNQLDIITSTTLDDATIIVGGGSSIIFDASGGTLTLGPNLTVDSGIDGDVLLFDESGTGGGGIINDGTINGDISSTTLGVEGGTFTNNGLITVAGSAFNADVTNFTNTGTINVTDGGILILNGAWTNTGVISVNDGTLELGGDFTTAQFLADLADFTLSDAVVNIIGTLDNTGSTLDVGPGSALGDLGITLGLAKGGDIIGGTILDEGDGLIFPYYQSGTLDGVTYQGTLDLSEADFFVLTIADGITLQDVTGTLPGTLLLTGYYNQIDISSSTTLDNATINIGGGSSINLDASGGTLTLGPNLTVNSGIDGDVSLFDESGTGGGGIINDGTINGDISGTTLGVEGGTFTNNGLITVAGSAFNADVTSFSNTGTIIVNDGGTLTLDGAWTNTGVISMTDATLALSAEVSTAQLLAELATITLSDATIELAGTLDNTGTTLDVGPGTFLGSLLLQPGSDIVGGTIADSGDGLAFIEDDYAYYDNSGTLDGLTYQGTLDLSSGSYGAVTITDGITLQGAGGTGAGAINLTGYEDTLFVNAGTLAGVTLDNATIDIGDYSALTFLDQDDTLTLGPNLILQQTGVGFVTLADLADAALPGGILNEGTISANVSGDSFYVSDSTSYTGDYDFSSFTNQGVINVDNGEGFYVNTSSFSNAGTINVTDGSTLFLNGDWSNSGDITVTDSTLDLYGTLTTALLQAFALSDATINLYGTLVNTGATLNVGPGDDITTLNLESGGDIVGGVVTDPNPGIVFAGGTLDGVTYLGTLDLDNGCASVAIADGITLEDTSGNLPGEIDLTGYGNSLYAPTGETLDNATIDIGDYDYIYFTGPGGTLTLGANLTLQQTVVGDSYLVNNSAEPDYVGGGGIVNDGTIDADIGSSNFFVTTYYEGYDNSFTNNGLITIDNGAGFLVELDSFSNTGTINVTNGSTLALTGSWNNSGDITVTDSTLDLYGTFTAATLQAIALSDATIDLYGTLDNTGATLNVGPGDDITALNLEGGGDIVGGVVSDPNPSIVFAGGTLDGVTYLGTLDLSNDYASVAIADGITLEDTFGNLPSEIDLTGYDSSLNAVTGETLDNATVEFGSYDFIYFSGLGGTLTLGADLTMQQTVGGAVNLYDNSSEVYYGGGGIVNDGTIDANVAGGSFSLTTYYEGYYSSFTNNGLITIDNGEGFFVETDYFANTGTINVTNGSTLDLIGSWSNSGDITVTDSTLDLGGTVITALLIADLAFGLTLSDATVNLTGTLENTGSTLDVGPGTVLGTLGLVGDIVGGVIADYGDGLAFNGGTLDGVTYLGTLDLSNDNASVAIADGITLEDTSGNQPGEIDLTGDNSALNAVTSETLDNATIEIGNDSYIYLDETGGTLTLGPNLTLQQVGTGFAELYDASAEGYYGGGGIVSDGTIDANVAGATFYVDGYNGYYSSSFINNGLITIDNGDSFYVYTSSFSNTGTINVIDGSTLTLTGNWSNSGDITVTNSTLDLYGSFTTASLQGFALSDATINLYGTLDNTGATLNVGPGDNVTALTLEGGGDIVGGALAHSGDGVAFNGGTLDGVTYQGTLDLSNDYASVAIADGITLEDISGNLPGEIDLTGYDTSLDAVTGETLDNATIEIGNYGSIDFDAIGGTLTFGPDLTLQQVGTGTAQLIDASLEVAFGGGGIVNYGTIDANVASDTFSVGGYSGGFDSSFTNNGLIIVDNGDSFVDAIEYFSNAGTIYVTNGSTLTLQDGWSSSGDITVANSTLDLYGDISTAALLAITFSAATVNFYGTLDNTGATLDVGAGSPISSLNLGYGGDIIGGAVADSGSGFDSFGGTLDGVSYQGTMELTGEYAAVSIADGINLQGSGGTGPGAVVLTGYAGYLDVATSTTLDDATIDIGNYATLDLTALAGTLTLGANLTLQQVSDGYGILIDGSGGGGGGIINDGMIIANLAGQTFYVEGASFTSNGVIYVQNGDDFYLESTVFTNLAGGTLTGGAYYVGQGSTLEIDNGSPITALAASVTLDGTGSELGADFVALDSTLATIEAGGTLSLLTSRSFLTSNLLTVDGLLLLLGGTLSTGGTLAIGAGGTLFGQGVVTSPIGNSGTVTAYGGLLILDDGVAGSGALKVAANGKLVLNASSSAGTILDSGTLQLGFGTYTAAAETVAVGGRIVGLGTITNAVVNDGTIESSGGLLILGGGASGPGTLLVDAGSTLDLAASTSVGTILDRGTLKLDGGAYTAATTVSAGGRVVGLGTIADAVSLAGTIEAKGGLLILAGGASGSGTLLVDAASKLE